MSTASPRTLASVPLRGERRPHAAVRAGIVAVLVLLGVLVRWDGLGRRAVFIDEAESAVNALTILQRGVPSGEYLGLPVYENTLIETWPQSEEYEFRDSSYGRGGLALYHGWLPLYAIAAAFVVAGVEPDEPVARPTVRHDERAVRHRVLAARAPSLLFAAAFLVLLYLVGRTWHGPAAGLVALAAGAVSADCIGYAQQARYYSASLALMTGCVWALGRIRRRGSRADWLVWSLLQAALFHTHVLAFAVCLLLAVPWGLAVLRRRHAGRLAPAAGILLVAILPWIVGTGFLHARPGGPPFRQLLEIPGDLLDYFRVRKDVSAGLALVLFVWLGAEALARRGHARVAAVLSAARPGLVLASAWIAASYAAFLLLIPAASGFYGRLTLLLVPPGLLLAAVGIASVTSLAVPRMPVIAAPLVCVLALVASGRSYLPSPTARRTYDRAAFEELVERLRALELDEDGRLYALPNMHLVLQFATGLPVQSIAPVRRSFLDGHPGEVVLLETDDPVPHPRPATVRDCARPAGLELTEPQAAEWAQRLRRQIRTSELSERVSEVVPPPETDLPEWTSCVIDVQFQRWENADYGILIDRHCPPLLRDWRPRSYSTFWPVFFYRFVGIEQRRGEDLNYAGRMRSARVEVLASGWAIYRSPPLAAGPVR